MSAHILLLTVLLAPSQISGDGGVITGTAVNGTLGQIPLSGAEIVLRVSQDGAFVPVADTTTDAEGRFKFESLPIESGVIYLAGVNRAGVHYPGPRVRLAPDHLTAQVKLIAFDAIESPSPLICRRHEIVVQPGQGFLEITESLSIENPSLTAFVGQQNGDVLPGTLRLSLPAGFDKVTFDKEFHGRNFKIVGGQLTTDLPWPPGSREIKFVYRLPTEERHYVFTRVLDQPTDRALVRILGKDVGRVACSLSSESTARESEKDFASGEPLPAGYQIELRLGDVPIRFEAYTRWIAVAVLVMIALGSLVVVRNGRSGSLAKNNHVEHKRERRTAVEVRRSRRPERITSSSRPSQ